ncbi:hypothetical protein [Novipirellula galeiformis]|uniref:hypothetical protein n=1 Tax=Novipirellula galeiformis TaxID=2528004 RepID=UPI0011B55E0D|nr:hypothetical protein [Novipirellula galeiformis]
MAPFSACVDVGEGVRDSKASDTKVVKVDRPVAVRSPSPRRCSAERLTLGSPAMAMMLSVNT